MHLQKRPLNGNLSRPLSNTVCRLADSQNRSDSARARTTSCFRHFHNFMEMKLDLWVIERITERLLPIMHVPDLLHYGVTATIVLFDFIQLFVPLSNRRSCMKYFPGLPKSYNLLTSIRNVQASLGLTEKCPPLRCRRTSGARPGEGPSGCSSSEPNSVACAALP